VLYIASFITLVALIIAFVVLRNPTAGQINVEFSTLFVAEWGIQIIGASQACCALELVILMKAIARS